MKKFSSKETLTFSLQSMDIEWFNGIYSISTDKKKLDLESVYNFISHSYWAAGIPFEVFEKSVQNSCIFGVYRAGEQVGFARVITDYATFAYLADVFILEPFRGIGLGKWLIEMIFSHPDLQGLRRCLLATKSAHALYRKVGFVEVKHPERFMEKLNLYAHE